MASENETNRREVFAGFSRSRAQDGSILLADHAFGHAIIACVGVGFGVVDQVAWVGCEVRASNELDAESESFFPGDGEVLCEDLRSSFKIGLVSAVYDSMARGGFVVFADVVQGPIKNAVLKRLLFRVEGEPDTP